LLEGVDVASLDEEATGGDPQPPYRLHLSEFQPAVPHEHARKCRTAVVLLRLWPADGAARAQPGDSMVGLTGRERNYPSQLSGGQQQRVAVARALINEPAILLADEPTGNLDSANSAEILEMMTRLNRDRGLTVIIVTHDADVAAYADRVITFRDGCHRLRHASEPPQPSNSARSPRLRSAGPSPDGGPRERESIDLHRRWR
jgi:macrolide transport system ATP-binding/permease protein